MGAFCRVCREDPKLPKDNKNVYISCNNCGSLACKDHYDFWPTNFNAFCTICFPYQCYQATTQVADLTQSLREASLNAERPAVLRTLAASIESDMALRSLLTTTEGEVLNKINSIMIQLASHFENFRKKSEEIRLKLKK